jgi:hypothetical protein
MSNKIKSGLVLTVAALMATSALAQDSSGDRRRGDNRPGTERPNRDDKAGERRADRKPADRPVTQPSKPQPPVTQPPVAQAPDTRDRGTRFWPYGFGRGNSTPGIDREQAEQSRDINRGIRNGSLTQREADSLRAEQARIAEMERRAKADGVVTGEERQRIRSAQRAADAHIYEETHDRERANGGRGHYGWRPWFGRW